MDNKPILWKKCIQKGLTQVSQLYENGQCIGVDKAKNEYGLSWMEYQTLLSAISKVLKQERKSDLALPEISLTARAVYNAILASKENNLSRRLNLWENETGVEIEWCVFKNSFVNVKKITNVPKYRSFQYRLLQRAVITNVHLCRWNKREDNLCYFCQEERETYVHLFLECAVVRHFWNQVVTFMDTFNQEEVNISKSNVMLNLITNSIYNVKNFICLLAKQYIYRQRCLDKALNMFEFKQHVFIIRNMEKYQATINGRLNQHNRKWNNESYPPRTGNENENEDYNIAMFTNIYVSNMQAR